MRQIRRLPAVIAGCAAMVAPVALIATPAAATPSQCLDQLAKNVFFGLGQSGPEPVVLSPTRRVTHVHAVNTSAACAGASVSIGISRPDGTDFRNVNAVAGHPSASWFGATHAMRWTDTGLWAIRQLAVKKDGRLAVRGFRADAAPDYAHVRRASILTGQVTRSTDTTITVYGYLKAYSTSGTVAVLAPGRQVQIQVRPHGTYQPYATIAVARTAQPGYWLGTGRLTAGRKYDLRVSWLTPYQTIASSFRWVAVVP